MKQVHAHELLKMIADKTVPMTLDEIKVMAINSKGDDAQYYACSVSDLDTDGIIDFFIERRKIIKKGNGYVVNFGEVCSHH
ncbi:MAG: YecH family metal-binding protein [Mangrovibacterium sp.]